MVLNYVRAMLSLKHHSDPIKRFFDLAVAVPSVIILSPLLVLIGFLVRMRIGAPVLFRQVRPGLHVKPFYIYKFRTMKDERDEEGKLLPDVGRLTLLGRFLRKTSLDELPELINVIKGNMSIVGPRPFLMQYLPYYTTKERLRFTVLPGITGLAQINGRNALSWDERLQHDVWYVKNSSFWLDILIILRTILKVLNGSGIVSDGVYGMLNLDDERRQKRSWDKIEQTDGE
jgi:sugar transferase EpsL